MKRFYKKVLFVIAVSCLFGGMTLNAQNLVQNPSFDTGQLAPWFGDNDNTVTIDTAAIHGDYMAIGNAAQNINLEANKNYTLTCSAKIVSAPEGERVWVGLRDSEGLVKNFELTQTDWEDVSIEFTTDETGAHKIWIWGQGASSYASDNWVLLLEGTSGVNDQDAQEKIKIVNSAEGVSVKMEDVSGNAQIFVHDLSGKQIYSSTTSQSTTLIERNVFRMSGIYVVSVVADGLQRVEKIAIF